MKYIRNLDEVLNKLNELESTHPETFTEIFDKFSKDRFTDKELELILDKIYKDGYLNYKRVNRENTFDLPYNEIPTLDRMYYINYDGVEFLDKGGYDFKIKSDKIDNRRKVIVDYALIIGGGGAVLAAVISLYNLFLSYNSCC